MDAAGLHQPAVIETDPSSSFVCDYVAGINRVLSLPPYLLVDNIGRNFEVWRLPSGDLQPAARARYDLTTYRDDPIASLLDVDLHAAFLRRGGRELLTVNHYGRVRGFELPAPAERMQPAWERQILGDTERIVLAGDCLIASSPRGEFTDDPPQPGVFLFEPVDRSIAAEAGETRRLACDQVLAEWGVISAVAIPAAATRLAVAAETRLGVFELACGSADLRLGDCLWEAPLRFHCQWLQFDETGRLWTGGPNGIDAFAADSGSHHLGIRLPDATAWGYGAEPLVLSPDGRTLYALGRDASLHMIDVSTGAQHRLYDPLEGVDGVTPSLGIGHAALHDGWLYAGFSRGGFRLLRYAQS
jgi:hypothetical protein